MRASAKSVVTLATAPRKECGGTDTYRVFTKLGRSLARRSKITIGSWILLIIIAGMAALTGFGGKTLFESMDTGDPVIPGTESAKVFNETQSGGERILYLIDNVPAAQMSSGTDVTDEILDLSTALEETDGVDSVISYPAVVSEIRAQVEDQRSQALDEVEAGFAEPQAEIDALAQVNPEQAAAAQAQLDAEKQEAISEVNEEIDRELDRLIAGDTAAGEADEGAVNPDSFRSSEGDGQIVIISLDEGLSEEQEQTVGSTVLALLDETTASLQGFDSGIDGYIQSVQLITDDIMSQVQTDLIIGEAIGLPIALFLMVIVFGGLLAAGLPLIGAISSIAVGMGVLWILAHLTAVDSFILNVISLIGLGLSIDYGLLIVSRFREEIQQLLPSLGYRADGQDIPRDLGKDQRKDLNSLISRALETTVATAGRTVFFSAIIIAISIASLLVMEAQILRMIAIGGIFTVLLAVSASLTLVPAFIKALGITLVRPSVLSKIPVLRGVATGTGDVSTEHGVFSKLAAFVHARPWPILIVVGALLVVMALPVANLHMRSSVDEYIPTNSESRQALSVLNDEYPAFRSSEIEILAAAGTDTVGASDYVAELEEMFPQGTIDVTDSRTDGTAMITVDLPVEDPISVEVEGYVDTIRGIDAEFDTWVGGSAALQMDFNDSLADGMPAALLIIVIAIFVLLFLMTGSIMVPLKAILLNGLSLVGSLGLSIWIFENGYFGLQASPGLEAYVVAIALAFGFGLAMDYEVFLLARIKEYWDKGYENDDAVERGLQRSGRIITSAAAIIIAVFIGFVFGELVIVTQVGVTLAIIVAIDATLVRMLLVPATMTLLGHWNWWAPKPLVKLHQRFGITHG